MVLLTIGGQVHGQSKQAVTEAKIAELRQQIAQVQARIERNQGEKNSLQEALKNTERSINAIDNRLLEIREAIGRELATLETLATEARILSGELDLESAQMTSEIRQLWSLQQGGGLRIIFGDQSPDRLARNMAFYRRLLNQRKDNIDRFLTLLDEIASNTAATQASEQRLDDQRQQLEQDRATAAGLQQERTETLAQINAEMASDTSKMAQLSADAQRLSELLEALRQTLAELDTPSDYKPFANMKGQMPYPLNAKPSYRFGSIRNSANMRWRGWLFPAREGEQVIAIHHGRVVYADWLRGQGLLIIIDHGEGYLSLYGHNRSLRKDVGDWVTPGTVIASAGSTGGRDAPGLYFEIRLDGKPIDPGQWLKR